MTYIVPISDRFFMHDSVNGWYETSLSTLTGHGYVNMMTLFQDFPDGTVGFEIENDRPPFDSTPCILQKIVRSKSGSILSWEFETNSSEKYVVYK